MANRVHSAEQLERLQAVTDVALSHLDLDALLGELLVRVREILEADTCAVLMLDPETDELVARAAIGIEEEVEAGVRIPVGGGFAGRVAATRQPVFLPDVDHADVLNPILHEKGIKSLLGVPLLRGESVIGVLHVGSLTYRTFTDEDTQLLQLAADRVARAIEHARAFGSERSARARLERVQSVTDVALSHLDLDALLAELLVRVREILEADTCAVLMLDPETNELVARAAIGIEEEVDRGVRIPVGRGFAGRVASTSSPVFLPDVDHADVLNPILREKGIKSLLGVPLLLAGEVVGVLHVGTLDYRTFTEEETHLLELAADRVSRAIDHARAFELERAARRRLEQVQAVTDVALSHLELDPLLAELMPRIRDTLEVDTVAVLLVDEAGDELVATATVGIEEEVEQRVRIPLGRGFAGRVAAERRPVVLPDVDSADIFNPILRQKGIKSLLGVPLLVRGEAIGVLHVGSLTPRNFTHRDVELLHLVGDRVALAVERARLHEQTVELDQLKLNFVAVASHELRTPATAVYGIVETLRHRAETLAPETRATLEDTLYEQSLRLRRLIEQLLDLSRLDASTIRIEPRRFAVADFLEDVTGSDMHVEVEPGLVVEADPIALERVVSNLVSNAQRYGEPPITVSAERSDTHFRIVVEDEGPGVPLELEARLFERFERGSAGVEGSGLGLAIARAYARAHGGDLYYDPRARGARFELVLPLS